MKKYLSLLLLLLLLGCAGKNAAPTAETAPTAAPKAAQQITIGVAPTAAPTATPEPTPTPTATPEPTPTPTPAPTPTPTPQPLLFTPSEEMPLPTMGTQVQRGQYFWIDGTVTGSQPIVLVRAEIVSSKIDENNRKYPAEKAYGKADKYTAYTADALRILGQDVGSETKVLAETQFKVTNEGWIQLQPNNLRLNYTTILNFFGSPERFMFRYKLQSGSHRITVDPAWEKQYVSSATCLNGKKWTCHVDAVPYFEAACRYMENTYIHLTGDKLDTGAVRLSDLVSKMNGTMVRRFTNSGDFISHHSFGTAVDINASFPSNKDNGTNRERIYSEVQKVTYNGIVTVKGKPCYDFTYAGTVRGGGVKTIPEPLTNYFLYELAFFRAGFSWGVYYPHKSDAMHFTLSELSPELFTDGPYAMRKVFTYIEDLPEAESTETPA